MVLPLTGFTKLCTLFMVPSRKRAHSHTCNQNTHAHLWRPRRRHQGRQLCLELLLNFAFFLVLFCYLFLTSYHKIQSNFCILDLGWVLHQNQQTIGNIHALPAATWKTRVTGWGNMQTHHLLRSGTSKWLGYFVSFISLIKPNYSLCPGKWPT